MSWSFFVLVASTYSDFLSEFSTQIFFLTGNPSFCPILSSLWNKTWLGAPSFLRRWFPKTQYRNGKRDKKMSNEGALIGGYHCTDPTGALLYTILRKLGYSPISVLDCMRVVLLWIASKFFHNTRAWAYAFKETLFPPGQETGETSSVRLPGCG